MSTTVKYTSADPALMPDNGKRYEVIEGDLYGSPQPSFEHQYTYGQLFRFLEEWNERTAQGMATLAPGLILAEDDDIAPDVIWISREPYTRPVDAVGHLHASDNLESPLFPGFSCQVSKLFLA